MKRIACILALIISSIYGPLRAAQPGNLTQLLNELSHRHQVKIAFSHIVTDRVTVRDDSFAGDIPAVLERWLAGTGLRYKDLEGNYYIYQAPQPPETVIPTPAPAAKRPEPEPAPAPIPAVRTTAWASILATSVTLPSGLPEVPFVRPEPIRIPVRTNLPAKPLPVAKWAVKTNLLYDATLTFNLGTEFAAGRKWTLDVSGNYNPWTFSENRKMKHWLVQPEARWWSCTRFSGHFVGIHAHTGGYNWGGMLPWGFGSGRMFGSIENPNIQNHRYQGWLAGAGVSYGYHWILGNRWGLEASLGVGYAYLDYDKYPCARCGRKIGSETKHYFGLTKAAISLVYILR